MCRLFGLHAGHCTIQATFWLLNAPDSLRKQSHQAPDGAGIGVFAPNGSPVVDKQIVAAWEDARFAREARNLRGTTFIAHLRYASTGERTIENTHPFVQDGRFYAHNGVVHGGETLDAEIAALGGADLVRGGTDSERLFALITLHTRQRQGDLSAGIVNAMKWVAENVPVFSLNMVLTTPTDLWALRYPLTHELYVLDRYPASLEEFDGATQQIHARSEELATRRSMVVATEVMDQSKGWRLLKPGELLHIGPELAAESIFPLPVEPRYPLTLAELDPAAAASQSRSGKC